MITTPPTIDFYIPCSNCSQNISPKTVKLVDSYAFSTAGTSASFWTFAGKCPKCGVHNTVSISTLDNESEDAHKEYLADLINQTESTKNFINMSTELQDKMESKIQNPL